MSVWTIAWGIVLGKFIWIFLNCIVEKINKRWVCTNKGAIHALDIERPKEPIGFKQETIRG